jgi:hypothetical protein
VQHIQRVGESNQLELIFFMERDHITQLRMIDCDTDILHSGVTIILSGYPPMKLALRLDSILFYFQTRQNDRYKLYELYAIKGGPTISKLGYGHLITDWLCQFPTFGREDPTTREQSLSVPQHQIQ